MQVGLGVLRLEATDEDVSGEAVIGRHIVDNGFRSRVVWALGY